VLGTALIRGRFVELSLRPVQRSNSSALSTTVTSQNTTGTTALFCGSHRLAAGISQAAAERGLGVPGDPAVVGYGDSPLAEHLELTTVRLPMKVLGQRPVQLLVADLHGADHDPVQLRLSGELVTRRSCGAKSQTSASLPGRRS
jgi:DNA-binding LacI/PurR family transcriptional regulator